MATKPPTFPVGSARRMATLADFFQFPLSRTKHQPKPTSNFPPISSPLYPSLKQHTVVGKQIKAVSAPTAKLPLVDPRLPATVSNADQGASSICKDPTVTATKDPLPTPPNKAKSYREAVSASWSQTIDVTFPTTSGSTLTTHLGEPALIISAEEEARLAQTFQFALIGKFVRGRPPMEVIRKTIQEAGFSGQCYVGLIDFRHVIFQFQLQSDYHRMWLKNFWTAGGFQAKIFRWTPEFTPEKEPSIVPVWVTFPLLPVHLCNKHTLFTLGSAVGVPLKLDLATAAMNKVLRPSQARICVEVDLLKNLPQRIWIGNKHQGNWQEIQYEKLPAYCTSCSKMGHSTSVCKMQQDNAKKLPPKRWIPKKIPNGQDKENEATTKQAPKDKGKGSLDDSYLADTPSSSGVVKRQDIPGLGVSHSVVNGEKELPQGQPTALIIDECSQVDKVECLQPNHKGKDLDQFLVNLGLFLELIHKQERIEQNEPPLVVTEPPKEDQNVMELSTSKGLHTDALNGEKVKHRSEVNTMTELQIIQNIQTVMWEETELAKLLPLNLPKRKKPIDVQILWEEGEHSTLVKANSSSDLMSLHLSPIASEDEVDGEDKWTETSFEEEPVDAFDSFLERMENSRKPYKHSQYMEALVSPKANMYSGRKLRDRNPRICYSESKKWNYR